MKFANCVLIAISIIYVCKGHLVQKLLEKTLSRIDGGTGSGGYTLEVREEVHNSNQNPGIPTNIVIAEISQPTNEASNHWDNSRFQGHQRHSLLGHHQRLKEILQRHHNAHHRKTFNMAPESEQNFVPSANSNGGVEVIEIYIPENLNQAPKGQSIEPGHLGNNEGSFSNNFHHQHNYGNVPFDNNAPQSNYNSNNQGQNERHQQQTYNDHQNSNCNNHPCQQTNYEQNTNINSMGSTNKGNHNDQNKQPSLNSQENWNNDPAHEDFSNISHVLPDSQDNTKNLTNKDSKRSSEDPEEFNIDVRFGDDKTN